MYGTFTGEVDVRLLNIFNGGRRMVQTLSTLVYTDEDGVISIPIGTATDWASVPRYLWWLFPVFDKSALAALLHDFLLTLVAQRKMSRRTADRKFREAMRMLGVSQWRRNALWLGVRFSAWFKGDRS